MNRTRILTRATWIAGTVALLIASPLLGQGPRGRGPDLDTHMANLTERLDLSEEQATALRPIFEEQFKARSELFAQAQGGGGRGQMRTAMGELQAKTDEKVKKVLTETQWTEYEKFMQEQRSRRRGPPGNR
jgi:Spy/CpxP family protein refolding chaperone